MLSQCVIAWCCPQGAIHISDSVPMSGIRLVSGPSRHIVTLIEQLAERKTPHAFPRVPGMASATNIDERLQVLRNFRRRLSEVVSRKIAAGEQLPISISEVRTHESVNNP